MFSVLSPVEFATPQKSCSAGLYYLYDMFFKKFVYSFFVVLRHQSVKRLTDFPDPCSADHGAFLLANFLCVII